MPTRALTTAGSLVLGAILMIPQYGNFGYCEQNEICFEYNLVSGLPVSAENNPTEPFGIMAAFGVNKSFFEVSSEVNSWAFNADTQDPASPYNESATWDSREGVTMAGDFTIFGRVTDVWLFYNSFGEVEGDYSAATGITDPRIYEALRQAGDWVDARMSELAENEDAEDIRQSPGSYAATLTTEVAAYMEPFGFTITRVRFPSRFEFPGGNVIAEARQELAAVNTEIQAANQELARASSTAAGQLSDATIEGNRLIAEANRYAGTLGAQTEAEIDRLTRLIESAGSVDGMLRLELARVQAELGEGGVLGQIILTDGSVLGESFYGEPTAVE